MHIKLRSFKSNHSIIFLENGILPVVSKKKMHATTYNLYVSIAANIWLGGSDLLSEGSWVWMGSGEAFSYTGWHPTEPNNYHGGEHCAMMMYNNNQNWADTNCADRNCFICETSA